MNCYCARHNNRHNSRLPNLGYNPQRGAITKVRFRSAARSASAPVIEQYPDTERMNQEYR